MDTVYVLSSVPNGEDITISVIALVIALAAVIFGPLVQNWTARRQTLAAMRQQWIENLRSTLVEYMTTTRVFCTKLKVDNKRATQDVYETLQSLHSTKYRVELMVNPKEDRNIKLMQQMTRLESAIGGANKGSEDFKPILRDIVLASQEVLKYEWDRIKRWEP